MTPSGGRGRTRSERLAQQIVSDAYAQGLGPGDSLPLEAKMMELYGTGRSTLREALRLLEAHGAITVRPGPGGGPRLTEVGADDLAHTMKLQLQLRGATYAEVADARVAVESFLARLAAERQDPKGMRSLRRLMDDIEDAEPGDAIDARAYTEFFSTLRAMSGNQVLELLGSVLADLVDRQTEGLVPLDETERSQVRNRYRKIADAIFEGRGDDAERLTQRSMRYRVRNVQRDQPEALEATVRWD